MGDPFNLQRFVDAQSGVYEAALSELRAGCKRTHWMWFVFPQLAGLGRSPTAKRFGVAGLAEAKAYLAHPLLGPRLTVCVDAALAHRDVSAEAVFGEIDAVKLRSCCTLFEAAGGGPGFAAALEAFFGSEPCALTTDALRAESPDA